MKRLIIALLIILSPCLAGAATYYVDNCDVTGNDANNGTATGTPWLTIHQVNTHASLAAGDSVLFRRGCTWREQLTVPTSGSAGTPIIIGAYGTGVNPIINGSDVVTAWTQTYVQEMVGTGIIFADGFEDGTTGAWASVTTAGTNTYVSSATAKINGDRGALLSFDGTNADNYATYSWAGSGEVWVRFDIKLTANFAAGAWTYTPLFKILDGSTTVASVFIQQNAVNSWSIGLQTIAAPIATFTPTLGTTYRIEVHYKRDASVGGAEWWVDGADNAGDFNRNTASYANKIQLGVIASAGAFVPTAGNFYIDDVRIKTNGVNGAYPQDPMEIAGWKATPAAAPGVVIRDAVNLLLQGTKASTATGQYHWDGTNVYIVDTPTAHSMEIGQRDYAVKADQKSYITVQDLTLYGASVAGLGFIRTGATAADTLIGQRLLAEHNQDGLHVKGSSYTLPDTRPVTNVTFQDSTVQNNTWNGVGIYGPWNDVIVQRLTAIGNTDETPAGVTPRGGIHAFGGRDGLALSTGEYIGYNLTVQDCESYNGNARGTANSPYIGVGIYLDTVKNGLVRRNKVHDNSNSGIFLEDNKDSSVYYNVVWNHTRRTDFSASIYLYRESSGNSVYNNVGYNSMFGLGVGSANVSNDGVIHNIIKNNIFTGWTYALAAEAGGHNDGTLGHGNIYTYNSFGPEAANFIIWGAGNYVSTYDNWQFEAGAGANVTDHFVNADPLFVSTTDFRLQAGSPAINAGVSVSLTRDYGGYSVSGTPDIGAWEYGAPTRQALGGTSGGVSQ
jgi:parallel beta-helix repeat protein